MQQKLFPMQIWRGPRVEDWGGVVNVVVKSKAIPIVLQEITVIRLF